MDSKSEISEVKKGNSGQIPRRTFLKAAGVTFVTTLLGDTAVEMLSRITTENRGPTVLFDKTDELYQIKKNDRKKYMVGLRNLITTGLEPGNFPNSLLEEMIVFVETDNGIDTELILTAQGWSSRTFKAGKTVDEPLSRSDVMAVSDSISQKDASTSLRDILVTLKYKPRAITLLRDLPLLPDGVDLKKFQQGQTCIVVRTEQYFYSFAKNQDFFQLNEAKVNLRKDFNDSFSFFTYDSTKNNLLSTRPIDQISRAVYGGVSIENETDIVGDNYVKLFPNNPTFYTQPEYAAHKAIYTKLTSLFQRPGK